MSLIPCSDKTAVFLCVVALLATAGTASAFSVSAEGVPAENAVDEDVSVSYTIDDPFTDAPNEWTLSGATELRNVSWTVTVLRAGDQVSQATYGDQSFRQELDIDNNGDEVRVELVGTAPAISNYTYEPAERYQVASLSRISGNNEEEFRNDTANHYTTESREARQAIDQAQAAIDAAGGNEEAQSTLNDAVVLYESENFQEAVDTANRAQTTAQEAQESAQTQQTLLLVGAALVVLLLLGGGGFYAYTQMSGDDYSKL